MKKCTNCQIEKELSNFSKNIRIKDGLQNQCKDCHKNYRENNKQLNCDKQIEKELLCNNCNILKDVSEFSPKSNSPRGIDYWCKECRRVYIKEHRNSNIEEYRKNQNIYRKNRLSWLSSLKEGKACKDCNKIYEPYCMDFDHLRDKIKPVTRMIFDNTPKLIILEEIAKCDLVCLLCHNTRTKNRLQNKEPLKYRGTTLKNIQIINEFKDQNCKACNMKYDLHNMQIDHIDPLLKFKNVSALKNYKTETLLEELKKCQALCALCHRRKSIWEQRAGKYKKEKVEIKKKEIDLIARTKECIKCHQIKSFDLFTAHKKTKDGYNSYCKDCFNEYRRNKRK